jgi:hypothetical protein
MEHEIAQTAPRLRIMQAHWNQEPVHVTQLPRPRPQPMFGSVSLAQRKFINGRMADREMEEEKQTDEETLTQTNK